MAYARQKCGCGKQADFKVFVTMYDVRVPTKERVTKSSSVIEVCSACLEKPSTTKAAPYRLRLLAASKEAWARVSTSRAERERIQSLATASTVPGRRSRSK